MEAAPRTWVDELTGMLPSQSSTAHYLVPLFYACLRPFGLLLSVSFVQCFFSFMFVVEITKFEDTPMQICVTAWISVSTNVQINQNWIVKVHCVLLIFPKDHKELKRLHLDYVRSNEKAVTTDCQRNFSKISVILLRIVCQRL